MGNLKALESVQVLRHTVAINIHTYLLARKSISLYVLLHHKVHFHAISWLGKIRVPRTFQFQIRFFCKVFCARRNFHERAGLNEKRARA